MACAVCAKQDGEGFGCSDCASWLCGGCVSDGAEMPCLESTAISCSAAEEADTQMMPAGKLVCNSWKRTSTKKSRLCAACSQDLMKQTLWTCRDCEVEICNACARVAGG